MVFDLLVLRAERPRSHGCETAAHPGLACLRRCACEPAGQTRPSIEHCAYGPAAEQAGLKQIRHWPACGGLTLWQAKLEVSFITSGSLHTVCGNKRVNYMHIWDTHGIDRATLIRPAASKMRVYLSDFMAHWFRRHHAQGYRRRILF